MENILGCMDLDIALRTKQLTYLMESSTSKQGKYYEKWDRSKHMSLMIIKLNIPEVFRGIYEKI